MKTRIGLLSGDACGIGPEIVAKLLHQDNVFERAQVVLIGDQRVFEAGARTAGLSLSCRRVSKEDIHDKISTDLLLLDRRNIDPAALKIGTVNAEVGKAMLADLTFAMDLASEGLLDALCFAPLNKQALSLGGNTFADELHFFAHHLEVESYCCEINIMDRIWTTRATSHVALRNIFQLLTKDRIFQAIQMADRGMREAGLEAPRILVAALNPHGGEGGLFGNEEEEVIVPAIEMATREGIRAEGPYPADTIFLKTKSTEPVGVVSMYHDQGQVALKLMGFKKGVTLQGGLPVPITTPAHGTAFDIAGRGIADDQTIRLAFDLAVKMGLKRKSEGEG